MFVDIQQAFDSVDHEILVCDVIRGITNDRFLFYMEKKKTSVGKYECYTLTLNFYSLSTVGFHSDSLIISYLHKLIL